MTNGGKNLMYGRSPYGERGLKFDAHRQRTSVRGRSPYGERGLKLPRQAGRRLRPGRSPYGERGLKYDDLLRRGRDSGSLSLRRAWIEIKKSNG